MIERKPFGSTGHKSSRTIFGAAALGAVSQEKADTALAALLEHGVNHLDVAASYGEAELRLAPWLKTRRAEFFLATKTGERTYAGAKAQLRASLERLGTDKIDLIQLHNLVDADQWKTAMGPGGALEALVEAKEAGLVDFIGVTGHGFGAPRRHLESLARYPFASVLLPYNWVIYQNADYAADFDRLVAACRERGVAVQTIKSIARRPWPGERKRSCWYEPLEDREHQSLAVGWVLGNPDIFLNTTGDVDLLPRVLEAAEERRPRPNDAAMRSLAEEMEMRFIFEGDAALSRP